MDSSDGKRIAKNTLVLYLRMLIVTIVGLFTSRIILSALGIEDFGLFSVVGGVVSLFTFFRSSMEKCTQRFLNVEMTKPEGRVNEIFNNALIIHAFIAVMAVLVAESLGLWFLNNYIQIPEGRSFAANCVYQTVVGGLLLTILSIPYCATIIANERMGIFAAISIIECFFYLGIALVISHANTDRLILYAVLLLLSKCFSFLFYIVYCHKKIVDTTLNLVYNRQICKEMMAYVSWTLVGHAMILGTNQGNSILVNMFHGVTSNAAMAVANQVNGHVLQLTGNFQTAFNPQITKSYASRDYDYLYKLIVSTSKISFFLLFVVCLPLLLNIDLILDVWLVDVPAQTNIFCVLMISSGILQATTAPLNFSVMATGRIKWFQIVTGCVFLSDLVILYGLFHLGLPAPTAMWVKLFIMIMVTIVRICFAHHLIPAIRVDHYLRDVIAPILFVSAICVTVALLLMRIADRVSVQIMVSFVIAVFAMAVIYFMGLSKREKQMLVEFVSRKKRR